MQEIIVVGGGGHAKVVISILKKLADLRVIGYTDQNDKGAILGVPHLGADSILAELDRKRERSAVIAVGQVGLGHQRENIWNKIRSQINCFPAFASPQAVINEGVTLGEGSIVMDGVVMNSGSVTGRGAIINTNSTVEHDVIIGDWVHIAPGATVSGGVKIGSHSMIGAGAVVIEGLTIATDCMVGAGATVVRSLTEPGVYAGCPARRVR